MILTINTSVFLIFDISNPFPLNEICLKEITSHTVFSELYLKFLELKEKITKSSKTCKLWVEYQNMVYLARKLIEADRSGSWKMHLSAIQECLPIFAAAGHFNYLKSAQWYLQNMMNLEFHNKDVHEKFMNGYHVIRRSDKFWGGLGADLVIEQTLMRTLKTPRGGISDAQRGRWTLALPIV